MAQTTAVWLAATSGKWTDAANWSTNPTFPTNGTPVGATYAATVAAAGPSYTVGLSTSIGLDALTVNSPTARVNQSAGTLSLSGILDVAAGAYQLSGGTIAGGRIQAEAGSFSLMVNQWGSATLDSVMLAAPLRVSQGQTIFLRNSLMLDGTTVTVQSAANATRAYVYTDGDVSVGGTGRIQFDGGSYGMLGGVPALGGNAGTLTIGPGVTVTTGTGGGELGGTAPAGGGYGTVNQGTVNVTTSQLAVGGVWTNQGTFNVSGGTLVLSGTFATPDLGTISHKGGTVVLAGTLNNDGRTLDLDAGIGPVTLSYGVIKGGRISSSTGASVVTGDYVPGLSTSETALDGVTLATPFTVAAGGPLTIRNGLTLDGGSIALGSVSSAGWGTITFVGPGQTLTGTGTVTMSGNGSGGSIVATGGQTLTVGPGITLTTTAGASGTLGSSPIQPVVFQGKAAPMPGGTLTFADVTIQGAVAAPIGTSIVLVDPTVGAGGVTTGTVTSTGGTVTLSGRVPLAAIASIGNTAGGNVSVAGFIPNANDALTFAGLTGRLTLNGATIVGGAFAPADPNLVIKALTLDGATVSAGATVAVASLGSLTFADAAVNAGTITTVPAGAGAGAGTVTVGRGATFNNAGGTMVIGQLSGDGPILLSGGSISATLVYGPVTVTAGHLSATTLKGMALSVSGDGSVAVAHRASGSMPQASISTFLGLAISDAGRVDLANADAEVINGSLADVTAAAATGWASGGWNGPGLDSATAAGDPAHLTGLAVVQNNTSSGAALFKTFDGIQVSPTDVLVKFTYYGDTNADGVVTAADYTRVDAGYLLNLTGWANGDFNYDGVIDGSDYSLMDNAFNHQPGGIYYISPYLVGTGEMGAGPAALFGGATAIPEPVSLGLACVGIAAMARQRRGR